MLQRGVTVIFIQRVYRGDAATAIHRLLSLCRISRWADNAPVPGSNPAACTKCYPRISALPCGSKDSSIWLIVHIGNTTELCNGVALKLYFCGILFESPSGFSAHFFVVFQSPRLTAELTAHVRMSGYVLLPNPFLLSIYDSILMSSDVILETPQYKTAEFQKLGILSELCDEATCLFERRTSKSAVQRSRRQQQTRNARER